MTEAEVLTNRLLIAIPKRWPAARVLRRNVGGAVGLSTVNAAITKILAGHLKEGVEMLRRPTRYGVPGETDVEGLIPIRGLAVFMGVEVKVGRDKPSVEQENFRTMILRMGGIHVYARELDQALNDLSQQIDLKSRNGWEAGK